MKKEEINLNNNVKLVSFITKNGIYVYRNDKLVGLMTNDMLLGETVI